MHRNNFSIIFLLSIFVVSCSGSVEKESIYENADNTGYVEYLWCKNGPDMSQEAFTSMISEWNEILDEVEKTESIFQLNCEDLDQASNFNSTSLSSSSIGMLANIHYGELIIDEPYDLVPNYVSPFKLGGKK